MLPLFRRSKEREREKSSFQRKTKKKEPTSNCSVQSDGKIQYPLWHGRRVVGIQGFPCGGGGGGGDVGDGEDLCVWSSPTLLYCMCIHALSRALCSVNHHKVYSGYPTELDPASECVPWREGGKLANFIHTHKKQLMTVTVTITRKST